MIVDHCFTIKGRGSVLTGTVIMGEFSVNDKIKLEEIQEER